MDSLKSTKKTQLIELPCGKMSLLYCGSGVLAQLSLEESTKDFPRLVEPKHVRNKESVFEFFFHCNAAFSTQPHEIFVVSFNLSQQSLEKHQRKVLIGKNVEKNTSKQYRKILVFSPYDMYKSG